MVKNSSKSGKRVLKQRVKTAHKRSPASTRWLERQLNDPYVQRAKDDGYRSRAAYKLLDMQAEFQILKAGMRVVDLGAAPGGWAQVAVAITQSSPDDPLVFGLDKLAIAPIAGAKLVEMDFMEIGAEEAIIDLCGGRADAVLSDMAPSFTGHPATDHLRTVALAEAALDLAEKILSEGGVFIAKMIQGSDEKPFVDRLRQSFTKAHHVKPPSSRSDSSERFLLAVGYKGKS